MKGLTKNYKEHIDSLFKNNNVHKIFGPAGTGKTTFLIDELKTLFKAGVVPSQIAFVSFTNKAVNELVARCAEEFKNLEQSEFKYFRTIHSLCYRADYNNKQIIKQSVLVKLARKHGLEVSSFKNIEDGFGIKTGDKVVNVESLSRLRMTPLRQQWIDCNYTDLPFSLVMDWSLIYTKFKKEEKVIDFTDMLGTFSEPLEVDYVFIDECQDLSPLQWWVMDKASKLAKNVYLAGDDDQSIYGWAGAEIDYILNIKTDKDTILPKSYRLPSAIYKQAKRVLKRIKKRKPKEYTHNGKEGKVEFASNYETIDYSKEEECLILCRNRWQLKGVKDHLQSNGYPYSLFGKSTLECKEVNAIIFWENMRKGAHLNPSQYKTVSSFSRKLKGIISTKHIPKDFLLLKWFEIMDLMEVEDRNYFRKVLQKGFKLTDKPHINLSTIHQSKGGEAKTVVLLTDVSHTVWENIWTDDEHRVWYVAITRAKEKLIVVQEQGTKFYKI